MKFTVFFSGLFSAQIFGAIGIVAFGLFFIGCGNLRPASVVPLGVPEMVFARVVSAEQGGEAGGSGLSASEENTQFDVSGGIILNPGTDKPSPDNSNSENTNDESTPVEQIATEKTGPIAPIELKVAQAFFEETTLKVKVHLTLKKQLPTDKVVVAVVGLREGIPVEEHSKILKEEVGVMEMPSGKTIVLTFALKESGLSEYQIRGSWGDDALKYLASKRSGAVASVQKSDPIKPEQKELSKGKPFSHASEGSGLDNPMEELANTRNEDLKPEEQTRMRLSSEASSAPADIRPLELSSLELERADSPCEAPPCVTLYSINATLFNSTNVALTNIQLAVGIYWVNDGQLPKVPGYLEPLTENEEVISLGAAALAANSEKKLRISVDREVPKVPGGQFIPHLRILTFSEADNRQSQKAHDGSNFLTEGVN